MPKYKVQIWEQVSVWQQVKVVIDAESEQHLDMKLKTNAFVIEDCFDADPDWNTESHMDYDTTYYKVLHNWEEPA